MNEADTCRKLVRPRLEAAGWDGDKHFYSEQTAFTDGRIIVPAGKPRRLKKKFSHFLPPDTCNPASGQISLRSTPGQRLTTGLTISQLCSGSLESDPYEQAARYCPVAAMEVLSE